MAMGVFSHMNYYRGHHLPNIGVCSFILWKSVLKMFTQYINPIGVSHLPTLRLAMKK